MEMSKIKALEDVTIWHIPGLADAHNKYVMREAGMILFVSLIVIINGDILQVRGMEEKDRA